MNVVQQRTRTLGIGLMEQPAFYRFGPALAIRHLEGADFCVDFRSLPPPWVQVSYLTFGCILPVTSPKFTRKRRAFNAVDQPVLAACKRAKLAVQPRLFSDKLSKSFAMILGVWPNSPLLLIIENSDFSPPVNPP
jgi:hypothetical protein